MSGSRVGSAGVHAAIAPTERGGPIIRVIVQPTPGTNAPRDNRHYRFHTDSLERSSRIFRISSRNCPRALLHAFFETTNPKE